MTRNSPILDRCIFSLLACISIASSGHAADNEDASAPMLEEVVVTASPLGGTLFEQAQPVNVLSGDRLRFRLEPTLGDTLSREPGISSTSFAPGASRPVIRGLADDRVRVLQNGTSTQDVANVSPDHAVSIDPLTIKSVEVVRGPATLLYGPNTIGGVVNVIEGRVPDSRVEKNEWGLPVRGRLDGRAASVDEERSGAGVLDFGVGPLQLHLDGFTRETQDYHIPGYARSGRLRERDPRPDREEPRDVVPNSFSRSEGGAIGASLVFENGYFGAAYSGYNSRYGNIAEPDVTIDLNQRRWDFRGGWRNPVRGIQEIRFKLGISDYQHTEFEGQLPGTVFDQQGYDGRVEIVHEKFGPFEGTLGFQSQSTDVVALGEEAFVPQVDTRVNSVFFFEEVKLAEKWRLQFGGRYDHQSNDSDTSERFQGQNRTFDAFSGSAGLVYTPVESWAVALTASYTQRPPTYVELFANGPHIATNSFEVGDESLGLERSFALDLTVRKKLGFVTGSASAFYYHFRDFISLSPTGLLALEEPGDVAGEGGEDAIGEGEEEEPLPVFAYRPVEANFFGGELEMTFHLVQSRDADLPAPTGKSKDAKVVSEPGLPAQPHRLDLTLRSDYVWAQDESTGRSLPRITPFRAGAEMVYAFKERFTARADVQYSARQNRTAEFELPTDSFFLVNVGVSYKVPVKGAELDFYVRGVNLLDEEARLHTSFLKDVAPLPGRGVLVGLRAEF